MLMYTLYYTIEQLDRFWSHKDRNSHIKLIHILADDFVNREDRYIVLVECSETQYTLLQML